MQNHTIFQSSKGLTDLPLQVLGTLAAVPLCPQSDLQSFPLQAIYKLSRKMEQNVVLGLVFC